MSNQRDRATNMLEARAQFGQRIMINVFKVIMACDLALTALSLATLMWRIISEAPPWLLAIAVA